MQPYQDKAWACLSEQEQVSLNLTLTQGLSTWEVGEILKLSHYKYLELKSRSEKFFRMFSDYFQKWSDLVRPGCPVEERFRDFLYGALLKRLPKGEAILYAGDSSWVVYPIRNGAIMNNMKSLHESTDEWDKDLYALIMEFDRWNNFRILPPLIQAPSAYKRRGTKKDKVYLRYLHCIPAFKINYLIDKYWNKGRLDKRWFIAFISSDVFGKKGYSIIPVKQEESILKELTDNKIYVFEDKDDAELFGIYVNSFYEKTIDNKGGLSFWKKYREIVETAINYKQINNMDFTCETLDMAFNLKRKTRKKNLS